jgi:hypothetical protein
MSKGKQSKFNARSNASLKRIPQNLETRQGKKEPFIVFSFKDFDRNQGQTFEEWQRDQLLALAINKLREICQLTVAEATSQQIIKSYTKVGFPPDSSFVHPKHVPPDVTWCSLHVQGKECVIGYFEEHIFHIVFLDKDHEFWKTKKKHT